LDRRAGAQGRGDSGERAADIERMARPVCARPRQQRAQQRQCRRAGTLPGPRIASLHANAPGEQRRFICL
jgi:hypothetical protein